MRVPLTAMALIWLVVLPACLNHQMHPLIGEDPEVYRLLGAPVPEDPETSPLAAARRLHQALTQRDAAVVWALLARSTRQQLQEAGAAAGLDSRDLLDRSVLPTRDGRLVTVSFMAVLLGGEVTGLETIAMGDDVATIGVTSPTGTTRELVFTREEDGWKIHLETLPQVE